MDWCNHGFEDPKTTYPLMSKALNASKRHIHFNMCEWGDENPWEWGDAIAQSWRMHGDHVGTWDSTADVIAASASIPRQYTGRPYGWNDMDMLEVSHRPPQALKRQAVANTPSHLLRALRSERQLFLNPSARWLSPPSSPVPTWRIADRKRPSRCPRQRQGVQHD